MAVRNGMTKKSPKTRNKFEARIEDQLQKAKINFEYETERLPYVIHGNYNPDFIVSTPKGKIYLETKGYFRPEHKRKMVAVKKAHPELDIRLIFYSANSTYVRWALKHGFPFAFREVPQDWLDGF